MPNPLFSMATNQPDVGVLGGFLASEQDQYARQNADRDLLDRDVKSEQLRLELEKQRMRGPMEAADAAAKLAQAERELENERSGFNQKKQQADLDIKIEQALSSKSERERREIREKAETTHRASQIMPTMDPNMEGLQTQNLWNLVVDEMERGGIEGFPRQYSTAAHQELIKRGKISAITIASTQAFALEDKRIEARRIDHEEARDARAFEGRENRASREENARVLAAGANARNAATISNSAAGKPQSHQLAEALDNKPVLKSSDLENYMGALKIEDAATYEKIKKEAAEKAEIRARNSQKDKKAIVAELTKNGVKDANKMSELELGSAMGEVKARESLVEKVLTRFAGKKLELPDGSVVQIKEGKIEPVAPVPASAPAPVKALPTAVDSPQPGKTIGTKENPYSNKTPSEAKSLGKGAYFTGTDGKLYQVK